MPGGTDIIEIRGVLLEPDRRPPCFFNFQKQILIFCVMVKFVNTKPLFNFKCYIKIVIPTTNSNQIKDRLQL